MLIYSDSLILVVWIGSSNNTWRSITKEKTPLLELVSRTGVEKFETKLEHTTEFTLDQIRTVCRDLGYRAPYKETNPHTYSGVVHKFKVTKPTLISKVEKMGAESGGESRGSNRLGPPM